MSNHIKAEIVRLMREEFDPCPPNYRSHSWHDCAEEVADSIVALFASPQTDLLSRAEVLRVIRSLGAQDADLAMYGAADNARAREYGEAAATRACCAIALMPPATPSPAPAAVDGATMIARHRFRLDADNNCAEIDSAGLAEEIDTALAKLAAERDGAREAWNDAEACLRIERRRAEAAEARASALEVERDRLVETCASIVDEWSKPQTMKLHAGEITAGEVRTARAILKGLAAAIRARAALSAKETT